MSAYYPSKEHIAGLENNAIKIYLCFEYEDDASMIQVMQMLQGIIKDT